jgi:hypothetical protein
MTGPHRSWAPAVRSGVSTAAEHGVDSCTIWRTCICKIRYACALCILHREGCLRIYLGDRQAAVDALLACRSTQPPPPCETRPTYTVYSYREGRCTLATCIAVTVHKRCTLQGQTRVYRRPLHETHTVYTWRISQGGVREEGAPALLLLRPIRPAWLCANFRCPARYARCERNPTFLEVNGPLRMSLIREHWWNRAEQRRLREVCEARVLAPLESDAGNSM